MRRCLDAREGFETGQPDGSVVLEELNRVRGSLVVQKEGRKEGTQDTKKEDT